MALPYEEAQLATTVVGAAHCGRPRSAFFGGPLTDGEPRTKHLHRRFVTRRGTARCGAATVGRPYDRFERANRKPRIAPAAIMICAGVVRSPRWARK